MDAGANADFDAAREHFLAGLRAFEAGDMAAAVAAYEASLRLLPGRASTLVNLAAARLRLGEPAAALTLLDAALAQDPREADALAHRGEALAQLGRHAEAVAACDAALALATDAASPLRGALLARRALALLDDGHAAAALRQFDELPGEMAVSAETTWHRGRALSALDRVAEAERAYRRAVQLQPELGAAWGHLGGLLKDVGRTDEAADCLRRALALEPDQPVHRFLLASIEGRDAPPMPPSGYVRGLFDEYAPSFDDHLVGALEYRAPQWLLRLVQPVLPADAHSTLTALDLGCGSGLLGLCLAPHVAAIDGVDLSPRMLERARSRGVYRQLVEDDVVQHLLGYPGWRTSPGLIAATDVLIYIGDLAPLFAAVAVALPPGGLFAFSVERAGDDVGYQLRPTSRYAHSRAYLQRLAASAGLRWRDELAAPLRREQRQAVDGLVVLLQR